MPLIFNHSRRYVEKLYFGKAPWPEQFPIRFSNKRKFRSHLYLAGNLANFLIPELISISVSISVR